MSKTQPTKSQPTHTPDSNATFIPGEQERVVIDQRLDVPVGPQITRAQQMAEADAVPVTTTAPATPPAVPSPAPQVNGPTSVRTVTNPPIQSTPKSVG